MADRPFAQSQPCPQPILDLIERFELHAETYRRQEYNETQVRREFIDPFFKALGWDVDNESGHAEAYKDVIHEDAIKVGGSTKAPDYCFRIGGVRKFFVEAKKPSVSVGDDPGPAYQLRRYAWTNKLPLSIVTDFEEFAVYDCRIKPKPDDKPSTARVLYLKCDEYLKRWDEIASIFSKDAILKGSFDKYAESNKRKRGTTEVDDEFLKEIENWRDELARSIALRNPNLSVRDLNYAVGKTIDRIIFLRMCEDRGVETYAQLRLLLNGPRVYPRLLDIFYKADQRYNSGLFHFEPEKNRPDPPDTLTPNLAIDDAVLKDIIKNLYYPQCPYEFSVMPPEILGQVYEQFLGKVITLTASHRAKVEYKPEVKKAGGVYYTPKYIVDYIVEHTVGKLLEGKTPADVGPILDSNPNRERKRPADQTGERKRPDCLCILDPACGSGSFLLGAYETLLRWHLQWYSQNGPEKWAKKKTPPIHQSAIGNRQSAIRPWRLTITEKKRILLNNIYGVDIDPQAVEVTKLSLLLKVLEGESQQTLDNQLRLFHERALPDLGGNIKCGNSLIGPDFYENQQLTLLDDEERYRINVFDWHGEFPQVFQSRDSNDQSRAPDQNRDSRRAVQQSRARKEADSPSHDDDNAPLPHGRGSDQYAPSGGFDAVIGNPPYVFARAKGFSDQDKAYFARYERQGYQLHSFTLFTERAFDLLCDGGRLGYIIPNNWLSIGTMKQFRDFVLRHTQDTVIVNHRYKVFVGASVDTSVLIARKGTPSIVSLYESHEPSCITLVAAVPVTLLIDEPMIQFRVHSKPDAARLLARIEASSVPLSEMATVKAGLKAYETGKGSPPQSDAMKHQRVYHANKRLNANYRTYLDGRDVGRYWLGWSGEYLKYGNNLAAPRNETLFEGPRILVRQIPSRLPYAINATIVSKDELNDINSMIVRDVRGHSLEYVLGIVNSRLLTFWFDLRFDKFQRRIFPQFKVNELAQFPVVSLHTDVHDDAVRHDRIVKLVQRMLDLHKQLAATKTPSGQTAIQRQIDATDRQIDQLVYELYGLTDDEIRIVEEATQR